MNRRSRLPVSEPVDAQRQADRRQSSGRPARDAQRHNLLECLVRVGELGRMIQYKHKGAAPSQSRMSLLSYPVLMAAEILLYRAHEVPVGQDQDQHDELARTKTAQFNRDYPLPDDSGLFTIPQTVNPPAGARLMDLQQPAMKKSKSNAPPPECCTCSIRPTWWRARSGGAVTDSQPGISYQPRERPGIATTLELGAACSGQSVQQLVDAHSGPGRKAGLAGVKETVTEAVLSVVTPIQRCYAELALDDVSVAFTQGSQHAHGVAAGAASGAPSDRFGTI
jgi:tryptophanyl-tRNA synthetase